MTSGPKLEKKRFLPLECSSIHYTCEQIEDTIRTFQESLKIFKEWKAQNEADLEHYRSADYLGESKSRLIQSSKEAITRHGEEILEWENDINRLLEILSEARTLKEHILGFWEEKDSKRKKGEDSVSR